MTERKINLERREQKSICAAITLDIPVLSNCVTLLTWTVHQKLIATGDNLIKAYKYWIKKRELREGWCPEVA